MFCNYVDKQKENQISSIMLPTVDHISVFRRSFPNKQKINIFQKLKTEMHKKIISKVTVLNVVNQIYCRGDDKILFAWPPTSPDATPCDLVVWCCVKERLYVPLLPPRIPENITADML
jgi:hypothetical protein